MAMSWFYLAMAAIFMALLYASSPAGQDHIRGLNKEGRIAKSSSNALANVRITNEFNNITYRPLSILPIDGNEFTLKVETVEHPRRPYSFTVLTSQFKHDVMLTLKDGFVNYRLVPREFVDKNYGIDDKGPIMDKGEVYDESSDSKYTEKELKILSEVDMDERTILEGELLNLKASRNEEVNKIIENTAKLSSSKYQGGNK